MILLHIITKNQKQAEEISDFLLMKKFVQDAFITKGSIRRAGRDNLIDSETNVMIMAKTRAVLFDKIDRAIRKKYQSELPTVYSLPIVYMDWDQASELKEAVKV